MKYPIQEQKYRKEVLNIWDIDSTLFETDAKVHINNGDGQRVRTLSPGEYNTHNLEPGHLYDFSEFRDGKQFRKTAIPINNVLDKAVRIISRQNEHSETLVLTARAEFNDHHEFIQAFRDHGFPIDKVSVITAGSLGGSAAKNKQIVIKQWISTGKFSRVRMWDDSVANLDAAAELETPDVKFELYLVKDGEITRYYPQKQLVRTIKTLASNK